MIPAIIRADDLKEWLISIQVLGESIYKDEKFALRFKFSDDYPIDSPQVTFLCAGEQGYEAREYL